MSSEPSLKKNFFLSTIYQFLTMLTPLITTPYISRVLGASGVGIYSYTYSIVTYFTIFAALGSASYGTREIAGNRDNKEQYSKIFWEIELLTILTTLACLTVWGIWILISRQYRIYYIILTSHLIATMIDISWFYIGMEQFKYTVSQNTIFKILGVLALFIFVKCENDIVIYTAIMSLTILFGNLSMWLYLPQFLVKINKRELKLKHHFKETLVYFIPTIATSIYTILDKTLIGSITHDIRENGYYEQATKIINMAKAITFTSLNSVLSSRISYLFTQKKYTEIKTKINQSINYILFIGIGICFGLLGVSDAFIPLFLGEGYDQVALLLKLLSPLVIIIGISNCLGSQYYTPIGLRKQSARYIIVGSFVNLLLNIILIPYVKSYGAAIATIVAETVITILYVINCNGVLTVQNILQLCWKKIVAAIVMLKIPYLFKNMGWENSIALPLQVICGGLIYILILSLLNDSFIRDFLAHIYNDKQRGKNE